MTLKALSVEDELHFPKSNFQERLEDVGFSIRRVRLTNSLINFKLNFLVSSKQDAWKIAWSWNNHLSGSSQLTEPWMVSEFLHLPGASASTRKIVELSV